MNKLSGDERAVDMVARLEDLVGVSRSQSRSGGGKDELLSEMEEVEWVME